MLNRFVALILMIAPLHAQSPNAPAVSLVLQVDPPPAGVPALDKASIVMALQTFATTQNLGYLPQGGNGWSLGIHLVPVQADQGRIMAKAFIRLSLIQGGQADAKSAKEDMGVIAAYDVAHFNQGLVAFCWELLFTQRVIADSPFLTQHAWKKLQHPTGDEVVAVDSERVRLAKSALFSPAIGKNLTNFVNPFRRARADIEVTMDAQGKPIYAIGRNGEEVVLLVTTESRLGCTFEPVVINTVPVAANFTQRLNISQFRE